VLRRLVVASVAVGASVSFAASPASAHATLDSASPPPESILDTAPAEIVLTFSEAVDPVPDAIRLVAADGIEVPLGPVGQERGDDTMSAAVPGLGRGTFVVVWRAVSADSHPISGAYTFSVGERSETTPGLVADLLDDAGGTGTADVWLGIGRWASFVGVAVLIGGPVALVLSAPERLRSRRASVLFVAGGVLGVVGTAVMIGAQAATTGGGIGDVLGTRSGQWWLWRLVGVLVAVAALAVGRRWLGAGGRVLALAAGLGLVAIVAAGGHGITGRAAPAGFVATAVHLAAMSLWAGGLAALVVVVPPRALLGAAGRFSPLALGSVVALAVTGAVNGWRQVGSLDAAFDTTYGRWLLVKLVLVVGVVTLGGVARWMVRHHEGGDDPAMGRLLLAEVVGLALVLGATAGLVDAPPPVDLAVGPASASAVEGNRIAQIVLDPSVAGGAELHVYISGGGGALDAADEITVEASLPSQGIGPLSLPVVDAGPNHVQSLDANLPVPGTWTFTVTARYGEFDQVVFTADLVVR
jgi:copper transport protein